MPLLEERGRVGLGSFAPFPRTLIPPTSAASGWKDGDQDRARSPCVKKRGPPVGPRVEEKQEKGNSRFPVF